jgi:hydroxymethylbilane synthase
VLDGGALTVHGFVGSPDGSEVYRDVERGAPADTEALGHRLAERMKAAGAGTLLERLRHEAAATS